MALFKEQTCACCGKKANVMTRTKLKDGNYICIDCLPAMPNYVKDCLSEYTLEDFQELKKYIVYSDTVLRAKFKKTLSYESVYLDSKHGLFYIDEGFTKPKLYLKIEDVFTYGMSFEADKYKEGMIFTTVKGNIYMMLNMITPNIVYNKVMAKGVTANARTKGLLGNKIVYDNPSGMDFFLEEFERTRQKFLSTPDLSR